MALQQNWRLLGRHLPPSLRTQVPRCEQTMPMILIVDDEEGLRELWSLTLAALPCNLVEAADGLAALELISLVFTKEFNYSVKIKLIC